MINIDRIIQRLSYPYFRIDARSTSHKPSLFLCLRAVFKHSNYLTQDNIPEAWLAIVRRVLDFRAKVQLKKFCLQQSGTRCTRPGRIFEVNDRWLMFACKVLPAPDFSRTTTVALATGRAYNGPLCFSRMIGAAKGVPGPLDLLPGTLYLAEEICESGCRARNK